MIDNNGIIKPYRKGVHIMPKIIPIKELKNTSDISEMCHRTDEPIYVTKNGYGDMVIMSMESYESQMKRIKMYEDIGTSEAQIKEGKVKDTSGIQRSRENLRGMREFCMEPFRGIQQCGRYLQSGSSLGTYNLEKKKSQLYD